jgi:hypothetical protein
VNQFFGKVFDVKNSISRPKQPIPWYPNSLTLEDVKGDVFVYSLYGYISKLSIFADKVVISINTRWGIYNFQMPAEQMLINQQDLDGKPVFSIDEFETTQSKISYELITNETHKQEITYELENNVLSQELCTGELIQILWNDNRPLDDLKNMSGLISSSLTSGRFIKIETLRIFSSKFATDERTKQNIINQCIQESTLN